MMEVEATQIATRFLESNGYLVVPRDSRGQRAHEKSPLYCAGAEWSVDH